MKRTTAILFTLAALAANARADSLYYIGTETKESSPLKWVVGMDFTWDDNVTPTITVGPGSNDEAMSVTPYVGVSFVSNSPETTWDVYARLGVIYYFDEPEAIGSDDMYEQARVGVNFTHRFSERLRFSSRSFVAYELEPDYSYGYSNSRATDPYLYWSTDNAIGFRWTERFATYTGISLTNYDYDSALVQSQDRFTWTAYNQFRFQMTPQTVLTFDYRYSQTEGDGVASNSTDQFILAGVEHRFSPTTIGIVRGGAQFRETDDAFGAAGTSTDDTSPYVELVLQSQINEQLSVRAFTRYGIESYDTVYGATEYTDRQVLRIGVAGEYALSPLLTLFAGVDYIGSSYDGGRNVFTGATAGGAPSEDILNLYIGMSYKLNDYLFLSASYNYTDCSNDLILNGDYDRNRVTVGVRAEF